MDRDRVYVGMPPGQMGRDTAGRGAGLDCSGPREGLVPVKDSWEFHHSLSPPPHMPVAASCFKKKKKMLYV